MSTGLSIYNDAGILEFGTSGTTLSFLASGVAASNVAKVLTIQKIAPITNVVVHSTVRYQIPTDQKALSGTTTVLIEDTTITITISGHNVDIDFIVLGN